MRTDFILSKPNQHAEGNMFLTVHQEAEAQEEMQTSTASPVF